MEERWYAVYTKPRWEKKVANLLSTKKIQNYCPLNKVVRQWSDRKKVLLEPLFTSYVFVRATEKEFSAVKMVDGVINLVHWLGKPAVIKDQEIETIKTFLHKHSNVQLEKLQVAIDDKIKVSSGFLQDKEGTVIAVMNNKVRVELPSLGYIMHANLEKSSIEKVTI